jgi:hypothetical protein
VSRAIRLICSGERAAARHAQGQRVLPQALRGDEIDSVLADCK